MARYNVHKRNTLDRLTLIYTLRMRSVIKRDLEKKIGRFVDALDSGRSSVDPKLDTVRPQVSKVFEDHRDGVVHVAVSDGIQEVSPEHELGLWEAFPESMPVENTLTVELAGRRDKLVRGIRKKTVAANAYKVPDLVNSLFESYLKGLRVSYEYLTHSWMRGEEDNEEHVIRALKDTFQRTDAEARRIFQTETTNYFNEARHDYFQENTGVDYMQLYAVTDGRISQICEDRHRAVITIEDAKKKEFMPAFHPWCYDPETELYTDKGWQFFKDVEIGQQTLSLDPLTQDLEWVPIIEKQVRQHDGEMIHITNKQHSVDMMVTPDHTMFYYKCKDDGSKRPHFDSTDIFLRNRAGGNWLYTTSKWRGIRPEFVDMNGIRMTPKQFCRFMAFYLSDGSTRYGSRNATYVQIAQTIGQDLMFDELKTYPFRKVTKTAGKIHIYDARVGAFCAQFGLAPAKFVPEVIKRMDPETIRHFLDAFVQCDGHVKKGKTDFRNAKFSDSRVCFTTSKRMADDLTELMIKAGRGCSTHVDHSKGNVQVFKNGTYTINHDLLIVSELHSEFRQARIVNRIPYSGPVYDVSLPKFHTLLTRRNGKIVWGSNCRTIQRPLISFLSAHKKLIDEGLAITAQKASWTPAVF